MADEPVEISALNANVSFITDTVSGNLQWFANSLVEKNFITRRVAQGVLATPQLAPDRQAGQLLDSVFTKIRTSDTRQRQWFDAFVDIFSREGAYQDLVRRLKKGVGGETNEGPTGILKVKPQTYGSFTLIFSIRFSSQITLPLTNQELHQQV